MGKGACAPLGLCVGVHIHSTLQPIKMGPLEPQDAGVGVTINTVVLVNGTPPRQEGSLKVCSHPYHPNPKGELPLHP